MPTLSVFCVIKPCLIFRLYLLCYYLWHYVKCQSINLINLLLNYNLPTGGLYHVAV